MNLKKFSNFSKRENQKYNCEDFVNHVNKYLDLHGYYSKGVKALECIESINGFLVLIDSKEVSLKEINNFCENVLFDKLPNYSIETEIVNDTVIVTFYQDFNVFDTNFFIEKMRRFDEYKEYLNFDLAINNEEIKEEFFKDAESIYLGVNKINEPVFMNLKDESNILITGETKSGKSCFIHEVIGSLIRKNSPEELQIALIDPQEGIEFGNYENNPHFQKYPLAKSQLEGIGMLGLVFEEYERRIKVLGKYKVRRMTDIPRDKWKEEGLHNIVLIIDEYYVVRFEGDKNKGEFIHEKLKSISSLMRFVGINLIVSMQNAEGVIDSKFLNNFSTKISFRMMRDSSYKYTFGFSPSFKFNLQGLGDGLMLKNGVFTRFQSANNPVDIFQDKNSFSEEERKNKFIKGMIHIQEKMKEPS